MSELSFDVDMIKATWLLDGLLVSPIKIAKWIVDEKLKIVGFYFGLKFNPATSIGVELPVLKTAAELDDVKFIEAKILCVSRLQAALWAMREVMDRAGGPDLEKTDNIEQHISNVLRSLLFDAHSFKSIFNETKPPNLIPVGDKENMAPMDNDGKGSAKEEILSYAKKRDKNGNPLVRGDFATDTDETIMAICKKYNVCPDTLRKYVQGNSLLKPSKTGAKPKNPKNGK